MDGRAASSEQSPLSFGSPWQGTLRPLPCPSSPHKDCAFTGTPIAGERSSPLRDISQRRICRGGLRPPAGVRSAPLQQGSGMESMGRTGLRQGQGRLHPGQM